MKTAIVIPARYGSTRFPGKPLAHIAGKSMLERVVDVARAASKGMEDDVQVLVATDDDRIGEHCAQIGVYFLMTPSDAPTGSDRVLAALRQLNEWPDFVVNLQGDAPFTPPSVVQALIHAFEVNRRVEVVTPVHRLSWAELDTLRESKKTTPFSGTTAILNTRNEALWFSKNILPAIRNESALRAGQAFSPVWQHMGLYGFRIDALEKFVMLPQGHYEALEGLEQLRMIENGLRIQAVPVEVDAAAFHSGIDSPEDLARAEERLRRNDPSCAA